MTRKTTISKIFSVLILSLVLAGSFSFISSTALAQNSAGPCGPFKEEGPLCVPESPFGNSTNSLAGQTTATGLIGTIIKIMLYFAGIIAVLFLVIGGYYYLTSRGNEEQATKGRQTLVYALLGLAIVILSYVIVTALTNQLTNG